METTTSGFFDTYPAFYGTSKTGATPERLNPRYEFIIARNRDLLDGACVVDLGSHDGRWSFAAHKAGAVRVIGIEPRRELVHAARLTMRELDVPETAISFVEADALAGLRALPDRSCDTVLCLGFFYHTMDHAALLTEMARVARRAWIFDTAVCRSDAPVILVQRVDAMAEWNAVPMGAVAGTALEGRPSRPALDLLIGQYGFTPEYLNWHDGTMTSWQGVEDYATGDRVTVRAIRRTEK